MTHGMCGFRLTRQASGQRITTPFFVVDCRAAKDFLLAGLGTRGSGWWEEVETDATGWGGSVRTRVTRLVGKRIPVVIIISSAVSLVCALPEATAFHRYCSLQPRHDPPRRLPYHPLPCSHPPHRQWQAVAFILPSLSFIYPVLPVRGDFGYDNGSTISTRSLPQHPFTPPTSRLPESDGRGCRCAGCGKRLPGCRHDVITFLCGPPRLHVNVVNLCDQ